MSEILIKGMEIPKGCHVCILCNMGDNLSDDWFCEALRGERLEAKNKTGIRRGDCPLVEVPPHGRLIDATELEASDAIIVGEDAWNMVHNAPTVLGASKWQ